MKHSPNWETGRCYGCGKKLTTTNAFQNCNGLKSEQANANAPKPESNKRGGSLESFESLEARKKS